MNNLSNLRTQIDVVDNQLIELLGKRMKIADNIGFLKKEEMKTIIRCAATILLASTMLSNASGADTGFPYSMGAPKGWEKYTPEWAGKVTNFRPPFLKSGAGEWIMFGQVMKEASGLTLSEAAIRDAKSKTFERGGILFTGEKELLKANSGVEILRAEFISKGHPNMVLSRYYIKRGGTLFWINTYAKTKASSRELEDYIMANVKLQKAE